MLPAVGKRFGQLAKGRRTRSRVFSATDHVAREFAARHGDLPFGLNRCGDPPFTARCLPRRRFRLTSRRQTARRPPPQIPAIERVCGVDYSGAAASGKSAWIAECDVGPSLALRRLASLGRLAGSNDRDAVNEWLVEQITGSQKTAWAMDFPFGLPIELKLGGWQPQLRLIRHFDGDAKALGRHLVERCQTLSGSMHIRRQTDVETATPFDCFHYRIIYQTFHGMRDVLAPLGRHGHVAVWPFQYGNVDADAVVMETCPSSVLKELKLPRRMYKQSGGRIPAAVHIKTRQTILRGLRPWVEISAYQRRIIMKDPGGDALDAVLAAVGGHQAFLHADHRRIAGDRRYPREGYVYCGPIHED